MDQEQRARSLGPLAALVRKHRIAAGLSQEALAERAGISTRGLSDLERGLSRSARLHTLARLADALGLSGDARTELLSAGQPVSSSSQPEPLAETSPPSPAPSTVRATQRPAPSLPVTLTSFVGRHAELAEARALLQERRLLTLVGPGGMGKTRLALAVCDSVASEYQDGVVFVGLAPVADAGLLVQTVATALGLQAEQTLLPALIQLLEPRQLLVMLDNCEHLAQACAEFVEQVLVSCPSVRILATSREPIGVRAETVWRVPALHLPQVDQMSDIQSLGQVEAVQLFVARARAVQRAFTLTEHNARAVAALCLRLDGIPLAIELAAARVRALSPAQLTARLDDRLRLLVDDGRTTPPRHQTLRATIDWSYDLLGDDERTLFARLAVFAGGWTLEAAESVCADDQLPLDAVLDLLVRLVDRSLVIAEPGQDGGMRYWMLETLRQYARERMAEQPSADALQQRHAEYFLALAREAEPELYGASQLAWINRLELELPNIRAALGWALRGGAVDIALELATALRFFWYLHGYYDEGCDWLQAGLQHPDARVPSVTRARALNAVGYLRSLSGRRSEGAHYLREGLAIGRALGDMPCVAFALRYLGTVANAENDARGARPYLEESLAYYRETGSRADVALGVMYLADALQLLGEYDHAERLYHESVDTLRALGNINILPYPLRRLAYLALRQGNARRAAELYRESLASNRQVGERQGIAASLVGIAEVAMALGDADDAARLIGAVDAVLADLGNQLLVLDREQYERTTAAVRTCLGDAALAKFRAIGERLSMQEAAELAQARNFG